MADELKNEHPTTLENAVRHDQSLARVQAVPWLIVIALLATVAWLGWRAFFYQEEGDPAASALWGGSAAGIRMTRSSPSLRWNSAAASRWPRCGGLKLPPNIPIFAMCGAPLSDDLCYSSRLFRRSMAA